MSYSVHLRKTKRSNTTSMFSIHHFWFWQHLCRMQLGICRCLALLGTMKEVEWQEEEESALNVLLSSFRETYTCKDHLTHTIYEQFLTRGCLKRETLTFVKEGITTLRSVCIYFFPLPFQLLRLPMCVPVWNYALMQSKACSSYFVSLQFTKWLRVLPCIEQHTTHL